MADQENKPPESFVDTSSDIFITCYLGLKTVLSEWQWIVMKGLRVWEIKQYKKRLDQEYITLGKIESGELFFSTEDEKKREWELSHKQIKGLQEEMEELQKELDKSRQDFIANRIQRWNLSS